MRYLLDDSHTDQVEKNISPPMARAITIPVLIDGKDVGVSIYVCQSSFRPNAVSIKTLQDIANSITVKQ